MPVISKVCAFSFYIFYTQTAFGICTERSCSSKSGDTWTVQLSLEKAASAASEGCCNYVQLKNPRLDIIPCNDSN